MATSMAGEKDAQTALRTSGKAFPASALNWPARLFDLLSIDHINFTATCNVRRRGRDGSGVAFGATSRSDMAGVEDLKGSLEGETVHTSAVVQAGHRAQRSDTVRLGSLCADIARIAEFHAAGFAMHLDSFANRLWVLRDDCAIGLWRVAPCGFEWAATASVDLPTVVPNAKAATYHTIRVALTTMAGEPIDRAAGCRPAKIACVLSEQWRFVTSNEARAVLAQSASPTA